MDKFKGHGLLLECIHGPIEDGIRGFWTVALINIEPNEMILCLEPFRSGIARCTFMKQRKIELTDEEQDMIFNTNIHPLIKYNYGLTYKFKSGINVSINTHFFKSNFIISIPRSPSFIWKSQIKDDILDPYEYKQIGQYFCRIPKTNKIYLNIIKDDDKYIKIWLLLIELHDIRTQIVWNMITLNRLDVNNYNDIY
jgi:hypothetical protein